MYEKITPPDTGSRITFKDGEPIVPDNPIIPFIRGDGTGVDIWPATQKVIDAAVQTAMVTSDKSAGLKSMRVTKLVTSTALTNIYPKTRYKRFKNTALPSKDL
jgi:isocitrate dehydrogenase